MEYMTLVFVNYFNGAFLQDGIDVSLFNLNTNALVASGTIGALPAMSNSGQLITQIDPGMYRVEFSGNNIPTGSHYAFISSFSTINTVPIFYQNNFTTTFTNSTSAITLVDASNDLLIPVIDAFGFMPGDYILVTGDFGVFLAIISSVDTIHEIINCVVTDLISGLPGGILNSGAFIYLFSPNSFKGQPGQNGKNAGQTLTTNTITVSASSFLADVRVVDPSSFPNNIYVALSDNVQVAYGTVFNNGLTQNLDVNFTYTTAPTGYVFNVNSNLFLTGLPSTIPSFVPGPQGNPGVGLVGATGQNGLGASYTLVDITTPSSTNISQPVLINDNRAFPVGSYMLIAGNGSSMSGLVTNTVSTTGCFLEVLSFVNGGNVIPAGSIATFSAPPSTVQGPPGLSIKGDKGLSVPGSGSTVSLTSTLIEPLGTIITINVQDPSSFPPLSYALLSDSTYSIIGEVVAYDISASTVSMKILEIPYGQPQGNSILPGAVLTFTGKPCSHRSNFGSNLPNIPNNSFPHHPVYFDKNFSTELTINGSTIQSGQALGTFTINLPNNTQTNYRLVVEFNGSVITNQTLNPTTPSAILGIASNFSTQAKNPSSIFAGYTPTPTPAPVIKYSVPVITDGVFNVASATTRASSTQLKYTGTFYSGNQIDLTLIGTADQLFTTFYVNGTMSVTAYPLI